MKAKVVHYANREKMPPFCGAGWYSDNPPVQDKGKVTCKRCIRWLDYYAKKGDGIQ